MKITLEIAKGEIQLLIDKIKGSGKAPFLEQLENQTALMYYLPNMKALSLLKQAIQEASDLQSFLLAIYAIHTRVKDYREGFIFGFFRGLLSPELDKFFTQTLNIKEYSLIETAKTITLIKNFCQQIDDEVKTKSEREKSKFNVDYFLENFDESKSKFDNFLCRLVEDLSTMNVNLDVQDDIESALRQNFQQVELDQKELQLFNKKIKSATEYIHATHKASRIIRKSDILLANNYEFVMRDLLEVCKTAISSFSEKANADKLMPVLVVSFLRLINTNPNLFYYIFETLDHCTKQICDLPSDHPLSGNGLFATGGDTEYALSSLQVAATHVNTHFSTKSKPVSFGKLHRHCDKMLLSLALQEIINTKTDLEQLFKKINDVIEAKNFNLPSVIIKKLDDVIAKCNAEKLKHPKVMEAFNKIINAIQKNNPKLLARTTVLQENMTARIDSMELIFSESLKKEVFETPEEKEIVCKHRLQQLSNKLTLVLKLNEIPKDENYTFNDLFFFNNLKLLKPMKKNIEYINQYLEKDLIVPGLSLKNCEELFIILNDLKEKLSNDANDKSLLRIVNESFSHTMLCFSQIFQLQKNHLNPSILKLQGNSRELR